MRQTEDGMMKYTQRILQNVIYSIGDTHGQGARVLELVSRLEAQSAERGEKAAFVQLGDLGDAFSYPNDDANTSNEALRADVYARMARLPELDAAMRDGRKVVNWQFLVVNGTRLFQGERRGLKTPLEVLESDDHVEVEAVFQATKVFETFKLFCEKQVSSPDRFFVVLGNHDADLLRGSSEYGRPQKHVLLGLLGFSPDEVIAHLETEQGAPEVMLRHPWIAWLNERPHLVMSRDTVYMHGGPTGALARALGTSHKAFERWLLQIDAARSQGWHHVAFREHWSFLSPDGASNDWIRHPSYITNFLAASRRPYLAVGHSPFLDFEKGPLIDLKNASDEIKHLFRTPARLEPAGKLIKQDTNMKRVGELWACRHVVGTDQWCGIDENLQEHPLRD